jgi:hypothetical protein
MPIVGAVVTALSVLMTVRELAVLSLPARSTERTKMTLLPVGSCAEGLIVQLKLEPDVEPAEDAVTAAVSINTGAA